MATTTLYPDIDTRIIDGAFANNNYATNTAIVLGAGGDARKDRALLKADWSSLSGTIIDNIDLMLYQYSGAGATAMTVDVRRVLRSWGEATATWNKYDGTNSWGTAGCSATSDRDSTPLVSLSVPDSINVWRTFSSQAFTDYVKTVVAGATDYGLLLSSSVEGNSTAWARTFYSSDYATDTTLRPKIVVTYRTATLTNPTNVAVSEDVGSVFVTCDAMSGATLYTFERKVGSGVWSALGTSRTPEYLDTTPQGGTSVMYRVRYDNASSATSGFTESGSVAIPKLVKYVQQTAANQVTVVFNFAPDSVAAADFGVSGATVNTAAANGTDPAGGTKIALTLAANLTFASYHTVTIEQTVHSTGLDAGAQTSWNVQSDWVADTTGWQASSVCTQLATQNDYAHLVYLASPGYTINVRSVDPDNVLSSAVTLGTVTDVHAQPGVFYLPDGTACCVRGGWTDVDMAVAQTSTPYGTDFGSFVNLPALPTGKPVYAKPAVLPNGTVFIFTHREVNEPVDMLLYTKTSAQAWGSGTWTVFVAGNGGTHYVYMQEPALIDMGEYTRIGVTWTVFLAGGDNGGSQWVGTKAIGYAYSDDNGTTWRKADGTALTLPINGYTFTDPILYPYTDWCSPETNLTFDSSGVPHITIVPQVLDTATSPDTLLTRGLTVRYWNGSAWASTVVGASDAERSCENASPYLGVGPSIVTTGVGDLQYLVSNRAVDGLPAVRGQVQTFLDYLKIDRSADGWATFTENIVTVLGYAAHVTFASDDRLLIFRSGGAARLAIVADAIPPVDPTGVTLASDGTVTFNAVDNETGSYVEWKLNGGAWGDQRTLAADDTSEAYGSLSGVTSLQARVQHYNVMGASNWVESNTIEAIAGSVSTTRTVSETVSGTGNLSRVVGESVAGTGSTFRVVSETVSGTGYLTRTVVENVGGTLAVTRQVGEGIASTLYVTRSVAEAIDGTLYTTRTVVESIDGTLSTARTVAEAIDGSAAVSRLVAESIAGTAPVTRTVIEDIAGTLYTVRVVEVTGSEVIIGVCPVTRLVSENVNGSVVTTRRVSENVTGTVNTRRMVAETIAGALSTLRRRAETVAGTLSTVREVLSSVMPTFPPYFSRGVSRRGSVTTASRRTSVTISSRRPSSRGSRR